MPKTEEGSWTFCLVSISYWAMSILCGKHGNVVQQHFKEHFEFQAFTAVYLGSMQDQA